MEVAIQAADSDAESDSDFDMSSSDLPNPSKTAVESGAKDLRPMFIDDPEVERQFSVRPVNCGGPVPTRTLEVCSFLVHQQIRTCWVRTDG